MAKLFLATLTDGLFDTVKDMKHMTESTVGKVTDAVLGGVNAIANNIPVFGTDKVHCSNALRHAMVSSLNIHEYLEYLKCTCFRRMAFLERWKQSTPALDNLTI
jgi:hypothetical protein